MANYKLLKRLERTVHFIKNKPGISKTVLLDKIIDATDSVVSERTLERDFTTLKTDFGLDIMYDRTLRGYKINEDPEQLAAFFKFAELSALAELYEAGLKDYKSFQKWIIPDDSSAFSGLPNMKIALQGITLSRKLTFTKYNYWRDDYNDYTVSPLRLKEYQNRWYLIAVPDGIQEIRNFGVDRLLDLKITDTPSEKSKEFDEQLTQYQYVVGLNYNKSDKVEHVVLKVSNKQINYLRSLPLHSSQICIAGTESDWGKVTYNLKPNHEFKIELLKMMKEIEVLEPLWFREEIAGDVRQMNELYN